MFQIVAVMLGLTGGTVAWFAANFYGGSLVLFSSCGRSRIVREVRDGEW